VWRAARGRRGAGTRSAGEHAGLEGTWGGLLGVRRFVGGVHLEAGAVQLADRSVIAVPLGDLERFG
jgi:hypothetical protein